MPGRLWFLDVFGFYLSQQHCSGSCRIAVAAVPRGVQHGASRPWLSVGFSGEVEQYDEKTGAPLSFQNIGM